jgi:hypothetical protein
VTFGTQSLRPSDAHRTAVLSLMLNRFAAARADEPPEIAEATRSRRS